eukprot:scaffold3793_cov397-Prasinococcus_capsulatus_cf.AAC.4
MGCLSRLHSLSLSPIARASAKSPRACCERHPLCGGGGPGPAEHCPQRSDLAVPLYCRLRHGPSALPRTSPARGRGAACRGTGRPSWLSSGQGGAGERRESASSSRRPADRQPGAPPTPSAAAPARRLRCTSAALNRRRVLPRAVAGWLVAAAQARCQRQRASSAAR